MRRVVSLLLVSVLVCLMTASAADAKGKKGKAKKAPPTVEELFSHMNPNSDGLVNEAGLVALKKWQTPSVTQEKADAYAKKLYPKILGYMKGDLSKGFNLAAYKAFKEAEAAKKAAKKAAAADKAAKKAAKQVDAAAPAK